MDLAKATVLMWRHLATNWIWKESTIATVLDLDKRLRVGANLRLLQEFVLDLDNNPKKNPIHRRGLG